MQNERFVTTAEPTVAESPEWWGSAIDMLLAETRAGASASRSGRSPRWCTWEARWLERVRSLSQGSGPTLSFCAGVTEHGAGDTVAATIARAGREMYEAKKAGRNTVLLD